MDFKFMRTFSTYSTAFFGVVAFCLAGCSGESGGAGAPTPASAASAPAGAASAPAAAQPPVTVTVVRAQARDLPVQIKATGTVTPLASVDVRSQMTSVVSKVHIREGQFVKAGELLFTLDARTEDANVAKARAQLARDGAALADAQRQFTRAQQLVEQKFISQGALDTSQAQVDAQVAAVAADQAALEATRVALSYARVLAPNSGRAGAINVFVGSAVQANVTPLVTVTQLDPIAVAFNLPQSNLADALAALKDGGAPVSANLPASMVAISAFTGHLKFVDNTVDAASGSVKVKAVFDNHDGKLWPGAFVEVSQTVSVLKGVVVIPQASIIQAARGPIVYIKEDGKAVQKSVQLIYAQDLDAAVKGVNAGDWVVLDGKQNLRPGTPVQERTAEKPADQAKKP
jgi:RND family efflux transporter MFP subunit